MKLTDYIFGSRRGREANRLEREAMADPFLADAVEGYDSVYGGHSDKLAELEQEVARRAVRPRRRAGRRRIVPLIRGAVAVAAVVAVAVVWYLWRPSSEVPSEEIAQAVRSFGLPAENLTEPAGDFAVPAEGFAEPSEGFWVEPADGQAEPAADFAAADEEAAPAVAETMRGCGQQGLRGQAVPAPPVRRRRRIFPPVWMQGRGVRRCCGTVRNLRHGTVTGKRLPQPFRRRGGIRCPIRRLRSISINIVGG
ncbi:MAG: hypothetical protein BHV63_06620 [Alistipes sp. 56_11]|nr:MAG: hypothetical protein BHV63_06620 [Alistipes sp. 56_11]